MTRGTRGSAFNNPISGMFDYKPSPMSNFGFNTQVGSLTGNNYSDFDLGKNIFSPEEKKKSGPFDFLKDQISKLNKGDDDDDLPDYLKGNSYKPEKESSRDQLAKFVLDRFGVGGGSGSNLYADSGNFVLRNPTEKQPQYIQGTEGSGGIGGAISGAASGYLGSGFNPLGAVVGGIGGLFCDVRLKEDIAPLCESEVNDVLSECAFFVKDLNECS